jgi:hypothetical protein
MNTRKTLHRMVREHWRWSFSLKSSFVKSLNYDYSGNNIVKIVAFIYASVLLIPSHLKILK